MTSAFFFAFVAVLLTSLGSRDQLLVARYSAHFGRRAPVLILGGLISVVAALTMAWGGYTIAALMPSAGKTMLAAIALLLAAGELAWPIRERKMREPTRSLAALGFVLFARQIGDGSRFLVFAFAVGSATPWLAGAGGALGGVVSIFLGWFLAGKLAKNLPLYAIRLVLALLTAVAAIFIGLTVRGLL